MKEYEIKFERWNILGRYHEVKYDYFKAYSIETAKNLCMRAYGSQIDFIHVEEFVG